MNIKSEVTLVIEGFKQCLRVASLPIISLILYIGLQSSSIFPDELFVKALSPQIAPKPHLWQPAYFGWYDLLMFFSIGFSFALGHIKIPKSSLIFLLVLALIIFLSFINGLTLNYGLILDGLIYFVRFTFAFCFTVWLVRWVGNKATESLVIVLFIFLAITPLFAYTLSYPQSLRMYASGMITASFGQVATVVCLLFGVNISFFC
jgi:hypothetical protein